MVSKILLFTLIVGTASAATFFGKLPPKPAHLAHIEGCYIKEINDVVPFGSTVTPIGYCNRIHCTGGGLDYASCSFVNTDDQNCYVTQTDLRKPYPHCCSDIKCIHENNVI